ncbi:MAG: YjbQ family protein [Proteobacteria bacterium]|nr:YjbQ family protein [Pseudomonadota bacterium]
MIKTVQIQSGAKTEFIDITGKVQDVVRESKTQEGICYLFVPHTTAAITINENADPSVHQDMVMELNKVIPFDDHYRHVEGNSAAHIKASIIGFSETVFIESGRLLLGTWQGIYFCEFDGPRNRRLHVKVITSH